VVLQTRPFTIHIPVSKLLVISKYHPQNKEYLFKVLPGILIAYTVMKLHLRTKKKTRGSRQDRLCGLVVRVLGYRSGGPGSIPGTTRKKK
jgi:hypothetical protein